MILAHGEIRPHIDPSCRIAPNAIISGDVNIGPNCSIGFGAVVTAESGPVRIGENVVIMDGAIIRGVRDQIMCIGDNVLIGPRSSLSGCLIGDEVFLATGTTIFNGAKIGARAEVRVNGVVHVGTHLAEDAMVPIGWIAVGQPAKIFAPCSHEEIWRIQKELNFPKKVFGVERPKAGTTIMPETMPKYAKSLRRRYPEDVEP